MHHSASTAKFASSKNAIPALQGFIQQSTIIRYSNDFRFNTLRPRQNVWHFPYNIFKHIFLNENVRISNTIWLKFAPKGLNDIDTALVQIMAWHLQQVTSHYRNQWWPRLAMHICFTRPKWVDIETCIYNVILHKMSCKTESCRNSRQTSDQNI